METPEFIDTFSDDLIYLKEARAALLTHPLRREFGPLLDASFCRLMAVFVIGSIEAMLEAWRDRDQINVLDKYFAKGLKNDARIRGLFDAFHDAGLRVDEKVFDDYLAIKYLRNTIVHGKWKECEQELLLKCEFPTDSRKLTKEHLDRIEHVSQNMMLYIVLTCSAGRKVRKPQKLIRLDETVTRRMDDTGILRLRDIDSIIWINLERIYAHISADIESTVTSEQYDWTKGYTPEDLGCLVHDERKLLFYLAARRAGEANYELLAQHRALAKDALEFWHEYWQRVMTPRAMDKERVQRALHVLESPHFRPEIPFWCAVCNLPEGDDATRLVTGVLKGDAPFTSDQVVDALRAGSSHMRRCRTSRR